MPDNYWHLTQFRKFDTIIKLEDNWGSISNLTIWQQSFQRTICSLWPLERLQLLRQQIDLIICPGTRNIASRMRRVLTTPEQPQRCSTYRKLLDITALTRVLVARALNISENESSKHPKNDPKKAVFVDLLILDHYKFSSNIVYYTQNYETYPPWKFQIDWWRNDRVILSTKLSRVELTLFKNETF